MNQTVSLLWIAQRVCSILQQNILKYLQYYDKINNLGVKFSPVDYSEYPLVLHNNFLR